MTVYHKIQTVFNRDPDNKYKTLLMDDFSRPAFEMLKDLQWDCTEKVDGTNIRIIWDEERVTFGGKTDNAQIPAPLVEHLITEYTPERLSRTLTGPVVLYGEGYGGKIQKGGVYSQHQSFILFDILAGDVWLERDTVEDIAGGDVDAHRSHRLYVHLIGSRRDDAARGSISAGRGFHYGGAGYASRGRLVGSYGATRDNQN